MKEVGNFHKTKIKQLYTIEIYSRNNNPPRGCDF